MHTSALQQDSEQTQQLVKARVFEEIQGCTYWDVQGFFEKYFEGKNWTDRAQDVYKSIKNQHIGGKWTKLLQCTQDNIQNWLFQLQDELLLKEQRRYYTINIPTELTGGRQQVNLIVKRKSGKPSDTEHDWGDIKVIGELKASNNDGVKRTLVQLARYARDVFTCQPTRQYLHAFTICGPFMTAWVFDRSGSYSPGPFNIHEQPERFIQVIAGYTMMTEEELGLDTFTEQDSNHRFIYVAQEGTEMKLQMKPQPLTRQRAIVCRGTSCYLTKVPYSKDWDHITKFSWTSDRRKPEAELLRLANQREVKGIARLPHSVLSGSFSNHHGLTITESSGEHLKKRKSVHAGPKSKRSKSNSRQSSAPQNEVTYDVKEAQGASLLAPSDSAYDNRVFHCLVIFPAGRPIHNYKSPLELLEALRDAVKAHRSLYSKGNILHRDISENNIIITDSKKTGFAGMLIDMDLAKELGTGRSGARYRTGTMEFMAIEVLLNIDHTYRHDLESFFYVLIWQCARRGWGEEWPKKSLLTNWYANSYRNIATAKRGVVGANGFELILEEFPPKFDSIKPLCRELRGILFPLRESDIFTGTPKDPEILYGPIIKAFDKAIDNIKVG
uniref:EKC/KEOPS complex subunit BUD32 n=1 Tax=Coccidioides posadasii RMSCC 3488 TaxID=454284 RepID=A0A0J6FFV3_COCPO|nr:hypothetical protein CPAG_04531 [Coccidioides posadasii RMSCC 3488]